MPRWWRRLAGIAGLCLGLAGCGDLPRPFAGQPGATAQRLSRPPPARLVVVKPVAALLADADAGTWAREAAGALVASEIPAFAIPPRRGDWRLELSATLQGDSVQPRYTLLDAAGHTNGVVAGQTVPASAWATPDSGLFRRDATQVAPKIVDLLRAVDATIKQSDPNSLYNRPARLFLSGVEGAPGDGNLSLALQMRARLPDGGDILVHSAGEADFTVQGVVRLTPGAAGAIQVEIHWVVGDPSGKLAGDVAQVHDFKHGDLDAHWGDIAAVVAEEAAAGVHEVITNWSGRHNTNPR